MVWQFFFSSYPTNPLEPLAHCKIKRNMAKSLDPPIKGEQLRVKRDILLDGTAEIGLVSLLLYFLNDWCFFSDFVGNDKSVLDLFGPKISSCLYLFFFLFLLVLSLLLWCLIRLGLSVSTGERKLLSGLICHLISWILIKRVLFFC